TNIIAVGAVDAVHICSREVFKPAVTASATAVILGHNHPSGIIDPSMEDILLTKQIMVIARLMNIMVHDHVIVDTRSDAFYSFCDKGKLEELKSDVSIFLKHFKTLNLGR
ncbi:MAG: hypothetical protein GY860_23415, partial [Desulfobacteraceae bacterium]|nr:hypothetical protein [Desulfobacteraceae bacterium]